MSMTRKIRKTENGIIATKYSSLYAEKQNKTMHTHIYSISQPLVFIPLTGAYRSWPRGAVGHTLDRSVNHSVDKEFTLTYTPMDSLQIVDYDNLIEHITAQSFTKKEKKS